MRRSMCTICCGQWVHSVFFIVEMREFPENFKMTQFQLIITALIIDIHIQDCIFYVLFRVPDFNCAIFACVCPVCVFGLSTHTDTHISSLFLATSRSFIERMQFCCKCFRRNRNIAADRETGITVCLLLYAGDDDDICFFQQL